MVCRKKCNSTFDQIEIFCANIPCKSLEEYLSEKVIVRIYQALAYAGEAQCIIALHGEAGG